MSQVKFAAIGECMIEMLAQGNGLYRLGFAGDTYNVAYYCRHSSQGPKQITVEYITALGDDVYSQQMLKRWLADDIHAAHVRQLTGQLPGLYFADIDEKFEKNYSYFRSNAAARCMFDGEAGDELCQTILDFDFIYLSGITLAILHTDGLNKLLDTLKMAHRQGCTVCFDSNYRPTLWQDASTAQRTINTVLRHTKIALLGFEDEQKLHGDQDISITAKRLRQLSVPEFVIKNGAQGYLLFADDQEKQVSVTPATHVVDTSAAGDSFNGAYLSQRAQGANPATAAGCGAQLAAIVISKQGTIIAPEEIPTFNQSVGRHLA